MKTIPQLILELNEIRDNRQKNFSSTPAFLNYCKEEATKKAAILSQIEQLSKCQKQNPFTAANAPAPGVRKKNQQQQLASVSILKH